MPHDNVAIRVEHVSKDFVLPHEKITSLKSAFTGMFRHGGTKEAQHALRDISFEIKKGEFFGIVGRNGSGKSTMLKILAGIYQPTKGKIAVEGKLVPFIELGVGFNPELTGRENVFLNGAMLGFSRSQIDNMYDDIVAFAELERFMDQKLKNYSSGMQVRLAFSMATRSNADVLLIDEVLAVGDANFQRKCFDYFKSLKKDKKTVVFVSHDMDAVREYCDRAVLIDNSRIIESGDVNKVTKAYRAMFVSEATTENVGNRFGDEGIVTDQLTAEVSDSKIVLKQMVLAKTDVDNPIIGIRIRDAAGKEVTGTNTKIENIGSFQLKAKQATIIRWEIPNILSDGKYFVDPAIIYQDGITVADWWDEALLLHITKSRNLPYIVDPGFTVKIK